MRAIVATLKRQRELEISRRIADLKQQTRQRLQQARSEGRDLVAEMRAAHDRLYFESCQIEGSKPFVKNGKVEVC